MNTFYHRWNGTARALLMVCALIFTCGCATTAGRKEELPPVLAQDELLRPYQKAASIEVRRARYGSPSDLTPADYGWAHQALREEAARIGADAVILPEVKVDLQRYLFFPTSEITAKGVAIKFR